jgi:glycosyltransferase involved in cell wall biosynthesis
MHVLHVESGRHLYGGPRQVLLLMRGLEAAGVRCTLACPTGSEIAAAAVADGLSVVTHEIGGDLDVTAVAFLGRLVQRVSPDIVHAHSRRGADFFGGLAATMSGVPAVLTRRVDSVDVPLVGRLKYLTYARVVAISEAIRLQLEAGGVDPARLRVIRSAVPVDDCQPVWSREQLLAAFSLSPDAAVVAIVAQLIERKGHAVLLDAWPAVRAAVPGARLLILGAGPLEATLRERARALDGITFAGFRPDVREFLGRIDVLAHPALREGLGVSVLEAQAAGVPVVAARAGGLPEVVIDGVTGRLTAPCDRHALANALVGLLGDPAQRAALGAAARARMRAEFSPARMVADYVALYAGLKAGRT